jgi:hypothetical protein
MRIFHAGFEPSQPPVRVCVGPGVRHAVRAELSALGLSRALVLTTPDQEAQGKALQAELGTLAHGLFSGARMHTPVEVTEVALGAAEGADCLVAIGGGSTVGLAKATGASATWNGPSTVFSVAPDGRRLLIASTSIEKPSVSDSRMNSCRSPLQIWPVFVRNAMPFSHSAWGISVVTLIALLICISS